MSDVRSHQPRHGELRIEDEQDGDPDGLDTAEALASTVEVTDFRSSILRHVVAGVLMLVLTLAGGGRGLAAVSGMTAASFGVPGVAFHICHAGEGDRSVPADRTHHDCCVACALSAPATLADAPSQTGPASAMHHVQHAMAMASAPTVARRRTPRQSQGPPAA